MLAAFAASAQETSPYKIEEEWGEWEYHDSHLLIYQGIDILVEYVRYYVQDMDVGAASFESISVHCDHSILAVSDGTVIYDGSTYSLGFGSVLAGDSIVVTTVCIDSMRNRMEFFQLTYLNQSRSSTSIAELKDSYEPIGAWPNPAGEHINAGIEGQYQYRIYGADGTLFIEGMSSDPEIRVGILPPGAYILHIRQDGLDYSNEFIKQ